MSPRLFFLFPLLMLTGCNLVAPAQPDSARFFVLTSPKPPADGQAGAGKLRLGLRSIKVADYLRQPMMTVRSHSNEVDFVNNARWAEPLEAGIARILFASLSAAPAVGSVIAAPFPFESERDYDIGVNVLQCEGGTSGGRTAARFEASVVITTGGPNPKVVAHRVFVAPAAEWDGSNYGRLAGLLSADVAALGQEIVGALPPAP
jgi:uncharacterized lipoprotein YmbA